MSIQVTDRIAARNLKNTQELMRHHEFHWMFNPYPILQSKPEGEWMIGIDYGAASVEEIRRFESLRATLELPVVETVKKRPLLAKMKFFVSRIRRFYLA